MDQVNADLRDLDKIDIVKLGKTLTKAPARKRLSNKEKSTLKAAVELASFLSPQLGFLKEPFNVADNPTGLSITMPKTVPVGSTGGTPKHFTLACGATVDLFAGVGGTAQFGLYGSKIHNELGVFVSAGGGIWVNAGFGAGPTVTFIFGPPSDLAGVSWGVGCDVSGSVLAPFAIGGILLFSDPRTRPIRFLGFAVGLSVGLSKFPVTFSVQVTNTVTKPLLNL